MVCEALTEQEHLEQNEKPMFLSDLLMSSTQFSLVGEVGAVEHEEVDDQKSRVLADMLTLGTIPTQFSFVCESDEVIEHEELAGTEQTKMLWDLLEDTKNNLGSLNSVIHSEECLEQEQANLPSTLHDLLMSPKNTAPLCNDSNSALNPSEECVEQEQANLPSTLHDLPMSTRKTGPLVNDSTSALNSSNSKQDDESSSETQYLGGEENLVLVSHDEKKLCYLVEEAGCRGVLDSGCSKSVAGVEWVGNYTNAIAPDFAKKIVLAPSSEIYQFGGGEKRKSKGNISVPTLIGDIRVFIGMDVVDAAIPLLIGTNSMKVGEAVLNFGSNEATFFGETVPMMEVGSGHFCIGLVSENLLSHIDDIEERDKKIQDALIATDTVQVSDLKKYHHYYGHTHPDKLLKFLKNAGKETEGLKGELVKIENTCESCNRSKRKKPRPQCTIPRADGPDQILTVDLKDWNGNGGKRYICYLIDMFSRLTSGSFISNKLPDTIVNCILEHWVSKFGIFKTMHSDIGGEVSNKIMEDVASKLGVELTTTASYSPHQNGVNERNHAVVDLMVVRMLESDRNLSPDTALLWALNAKNSLENHLGYSPFQLHIGRNPKLLSVTRDGPPSYENTSVSKNFVAHVNAMMSAREQFIKAESSFSLKRALKKKLHTRGHDIQEGDLIYYKKVEGKAKSVIWKGPSKVTAVNGKKLFIDQGARCATVNRDDSVRVGEEFWRMDQLPEQKGEKRLKKKKKKKTSSKQKDSVLEDRMQLRSILKKGNRDLRTAQKLEVDVSSTSSSSAEEGDVDVEEESVEEEEVETAENGEEEVESAEEEGADESNNADSEEEDTVSDSEATLPEHSSQSDDNDENHLNSDTEYEDATDTNESSKMSSVSTSYSCENVEKGDIISYYIPETDTEEMARVLQRGAKATGPNRYWWNVEVQGSLERKSVNTQAVQNLKKVNDTFYAQVIPTLVVAIPRYLHKAPECIAAKEKELQNWKDFSVYREVEDVGQECINTNWLLVRKDIGIKARLCLRGDKEPGVHDICTDSPTVNKINIKLFYLIALARGWRIQTADVKAAFLQGSTLERDVFVRPPVEARVPGVLWQMIKRAYGLVDASRGFYLELEKTLFNVGCELSRYDPAMYIYF